MNTTSWPTQASVASWQSLKGESRSFWATARTWLLDLFTAPSMRDVEPRCLPSVAFTPSGPLVYQWQIALRKIDKFYVKYDLAPSPCPSVGTPIQPLILLLPIRTSDLEDQCRSRIPESPIPQHESRQEDL